MARFGTKAINAFAWTKVSAFLSKTIPATVTCCEVVYIWQCSRILHNTSFEIIKRKASFVRFCHDGDNNSDNMLRRRDVA
jgi:hypothetical protein